MLSLTSPSVEGSAPYTLVFLILAVTIYVYRRGGSRSTGSQAPVVRGASYQKRTSPSLQSNVIWGCDLGIQSLHRTASTLLVQHQEIMSCLNGIRILLGLDGKVSYLLESSDV